MYQLLYSSLQPLIKSLTLNYLSADESLGTVHCDGPDGVLSQVLGDLEDEARLPARHVQGVEDLGQALVELDVNHGADDGQDLALEKE